MKSYIYLLLILISGFSHQALSQTSVVIVAAGASPQESYAVKVLKKALTAKGFVLKSKKATYTVRLTIAANKYVKEAFHIQAFGKNITIQGHDESGLIYGSFAL